MKRHFFLCLALCIVIQYLPETSSASLSWISFVNPRIEYLDSDSYRLRVEVNWGGENMIWGETDPEGPPPGGQIPPAFNYFDLTLLGTTQYNPTLNYHPWDKDYSSAGLWYSQSMYNNLGMYGAHPFESTLFGYDFDYNGPIRDEFSLDFNARIEWSMRWDPMHRFFAEEWHSGSFVASVIPEPKPLYLILAGLFTMGLTVIKQR